MKLVIISDIHANYDALTALPEDYNELWALGDLVNYGPEPSEVLEWVRSRAAIAVRGNHDHAVGFGESPRCSAPYRLMAAETQRYTESTVTDRQKQFLQNLPARAEREVAGTRFLLCHAMPSDPLFGYCEPHSRLWAKETERLSTDVLLVGHTHLPFTRRIGNCTVVNPGSLGQPKTGGPNACYAVWNDGAIELKSFSYPFEQTIAKIGSLPIPDHVRQELTSVLRTGGSF